jgi:hypothetical protein
MKARWFRTCGVLLACATMSIVACGDDDGDDAGTAGTGGGGAGMTAGTGGGGTGGGKAGSGGTGGSMAVVCGGQTCMVNATLKLVNPAAQACCTADMKCGAYNTAMKCLLNNAPGKADSSCPTITVKVMGTDYPQTGCCTPDNKCGNDFMAVGWGCQARENLDSTMGGPLMPMMCGAGDSGADAGL